jgi:ATP phosphoribosyltransferase regulatory subunit
MSDLWLLPAGIEDLLPAEAAQLERLRRALIDYYICCGYDQVCPPLVEHLDSLLCIGGADLNLETFKLTDHLSGKQLGVRADMTPQIARIDAHVLGVSEPQRLCYAGPVLRARTRQTFESREQFQVGAELYGSTNANADVEIVELMLRSISLCGFERPHLDIGHVGVFRSLARKAAVPGDAEATLFDALQRKSVPDLERAVHDLALPESLARALVSLPGLRGPVSELDAALEFLSGIDDEVVVAANNLRNVVEAIGDRHDSSDMYFDLSELRGYYYHTGVVFSAFVAGHGREIARGGRYDHVGAAFGRSRSATGFSLDLRQVVRLKNGYQDAERNCILAPAFATDKRLNEMINELRDSGETVVRQLDDNVVGAAISRCDRRLVFDGETWRVVPLDSKQ